MRGPSGVPVIEAIPFTYIHLLHNLYLISVMGSLFRQYICTVYILFFLHGTEKGPKSVRCDMVWFTMLSYLRWVKIWSYLDFRYSRRRILRDKRPCTTTVSALHHTIWIFTDPPLRVKWSWWETVRRPNSWKYTLVEVSGHNLESSQTWSFYLRFWLPIKGYSWTNWVFFIDCFVWISETIGGGGVWFSIRFCFFLNFEVQAVEISSKRKQKVGSKIR